MSFEAGQVWKTRGGHLVEIESVSYPSEIWPIFGRILDSRKDSECGRTFMRDGTYDVNHYQSQFDLMERVNYERVEVVAEEEALQEAQEIPEIVEKPVDPIRQYFIDSLVMKAFEHSLKTGESLRSYRNYLYYAIELRDSLK